MSRWKHNLCEAMVAMLMAPAVALTLGAIPGIAREWSGGALAATPPASSPTVHSEAATAITPFDAQLEARVTPEDQATEWHFEYAEKASGQALEGPVSVGSGTMSGNLEEQLAGPVDIGGGLKPTTTYHYRVVASNASGTASGPVQSFTTLATQTPAIEGESESGIGHTAVTLSGVVNPQFEPVSTCEFQYATEATYNATRFTGALSAECKPSAPELGSGDGGVGVGASLEGLEPNTTYYYRLIASNKTGTGEGTPQHFLTLPNPPRVKTRGASEVGPHSATIEAEVTPGSSGPNSGTTYFFQYSTDEGYSSQVPLTPGDAGQGDAPVKESAKLEGLQPDTTYHYRIVASNDNSSTSGGAPQLTYGEGEEFGTVATPPLIGATPVGEVTQNSAHISAAVDGEGLPTRYELRLGTEAGTLRFRASGRFEAAGEHTVSFALSGLQGGTTYRYQLLVVNPDGSVESPQGSFTTPPAPVIQTLPLASFPQTPLLGVPPGFFSKGEAPVTSTSTSTTSGKPTRAQKLKAALRACKRKPKSTRNTCERQARQRYGSGEKSKRSGRKG
jgi:phosphodiesterase/alkaline phosphatase D-like protein